MQIYEVTDARFRKYGKVIRNIDFSALTEAMKKTPVPSDVVYEPSIAELEALPVAKEIEKVFYGELPIQIGYCNGHNVLLNAVEYHRSSEINLAATDAVLILGSEADVTDDFTYETSKVEAFLVPAGTGIEIYGTTLHYAPCGVDGNGFKAIVVLPQGTNTDLMTCHTKSYDDKLLTAKNKWLIAHEEAGIEGAVCGLKGENIDLAK